MAGGGRARLERLAQRRGSEQKTIIPFSAQVLAMAVGIAVKLSKMRGTFPVFATRSAAFSSTGWRGAGRRGRIRWFREGFSQPCWYRKAQWLPGGPGAPLQRKRDHDCSQEPSTILASCFNRHTTVSRSPEGVSTTHIDSVAVMIRHGIEDALDIEISLNSAETHTR